MANNAPQPPPDSSGIRVGDVGGSVNFSALGDIVAGDKITNITTTIQISVEAITQRPLITASPYRGLDRFEDKDKDLFFGRDQLIKSLLAQLSASNVLLVLGASGSGKSSVVRAGLLPHLSQLIGARFRYFTFVPDMNPFESLRSALQAGGFNQTQTRGLLEAKPETPAELIHALQSDGDQWLLFVDQFEEIFTVSDEGLRASFIAALVRIAQDASSSTKLVLAMRADFLDRLSPFPQFAKIIEKNIDFVADMHVDELRQAIEQPAARHGVVFEQGLVEEIIKDVQGQAGSLPLLQYTLDLLWQDEAHKDGLADRHLNTKTYRDLGGVRGALQKRADEIYASSGDGSDSKTPSPKQEIVRQIFLRLVDLAGESSSDAMWRPVRRRTSMATFATEQEKEILQALINQKLLVSNREADDSTVEVAHEALFTSWARLKNWIEAGKQVIFARNRLADDARRWQRRQEEGDAGADEELLSGSRLAQALDMRARGDFATVVGGLEKSEAEFLDASFALRERRAQEEQLRQQRELEAAQRLAEARSLAAGRLRKGLAIAVLLLLAAIMSGVFAFLNAKKATQTLTDADFLQAGQMIEQGKVDEALAHLARAVRTSPQNSAALDRIFTLLTHRSFLLPGSAPIKFKGRITSLCFTPDHRCLVATTTGTTAQVFDARSGQLLAGPFQHEGKPVRMAQFSGDGKLLATACGASESSEPQECDVWPHYRGLWASSGGAGGFASVWEIATGKLQAGPLKHEKPVVDVRFSHDGTRVVTASEDQTARIWDVRTGEQRTPALQHESALFSAQFSPDDKRIVSSSRSFNIWDASTGQRIAGPPLSAGRTLATQYSPNGAFIAVVFDEPSDDESRQTVQIFNAETGNITHNSGNSVPLVTSITFSPDSKRVFVSFSGRYRNKDDSGGIVEIETATGKFNDQFTDGISVHSAMVSPKTEQVFAGLGDRTLQRWKKIVSLADPKTPNILPAKLSGTPLHFASDPSLSTFAVLFRDSATGGDETENTWVQFWNLPSAVARCELRPTPPQKATQSNSQETEVVADTSRDGRRILKLKADAVTVCDAKTGRQIGAQIHLQADYGGFFGMQTAKFSPDGSSFATGEGGDFRIAKGFARIWDSLTGNPLSPPLVHHSAVTFVSFSEDGKRLVTIESNLPKENLRNARVWDVRTGLPLTEVMRSKVASESAQFNRERDQLTGLSPGEGESEGVAEIWDIGFPSNERPPDWLPRLAEIVGGFQLNSETGALEPLPGRWRELDALRSKLGTSTEIDRFTVFAKWLLADPFDRTVSPFTKMTIAEYVDWCLARGDDNLTDEAEAVAAGNDALTAKVAAKRPR